MESLISQQNKWQKRALRVLSDLKLIETLSKIGEPKIVGSLSLGLMVGPDIDIDLESKSISEHQYFSVVEYLFAQKNLRRLILADNRILSQKLKARGIPPSLYLGLIITDSQKLDWKIDIRFVLSKSSRAEKYIANIKKELTPEKIKTILNIKSKVFLHPLYINRLISAVDIYNFVLYSNGRTISGFKAYLWKNKRIKF